MLPGQAEERLADLAVKVCDDLHHNVNPSHRAVTLDEAITGAASLGYTSGELGVALMEVSGCAWVVRERPMLFDR